MITLLEVDSSGEHFDITDEDKKNFILTELATTYSDDADFLRKINKITFGLISK